MNDYDKTYLQLLEISKQPSMEVKRLRILITEIFKTFNDSNLVFMKDIFIIVKTKITENIIFRYRAATRQDMEKNSLRVLAAHICNSLPENRFNLTLRYFERIVWV